MRSMSNSSTRGSAKVVQLTTKAVVTVLDLSLLPREEKLRVVREMAKEIAYVHHLSTIRLVCRAS